ncbi:MAG TPA: transglycosylase SLT domain-containing protein [Actinomycetota bacterium]|nr:transglycosylase SLT domain-containing protein [Actinomycetota bacterium]
MRRALVLLLAAAMLTAPACAGTDPPSANADPNAMGPTGPLASPRATGATSRSASTTADPELPSPDAWVPRRPGVLAAALETTRSARRLAVDRWIASGAPGTWPPPEDVQLLTLYEQRIYRVLAANDRLASRVLGRLDRGTVGEARANVVAGAALYDHFSPVKKLPDFRLRSPEPADALRAYFEKGERRFAVHWELLAAVMLIETRMGRIVSDSSAGAQGPMQFIPSTWASYGLGGDVHDPHDAVLGAANYLSANGAPGDDRNALFHYNPVPAYVTAVTRYAKAMERDPDLFYAYYNWQVFVRTTRGDVRLTGPGL